MKKLIAESLTFAFDDARVVLQDLSLELHRGEMLVLLGANGAGKTTLLRLLAGHLQASGGRVLFDEVPINRLSRQAIAQRVSLMPQAELRQTELSVREMVRLGRAAHAGWWAPLREEDEAKVNDALAQLELTDLADQAVTTLSGGQWRRAILARSLAQAADALLLDEPTSGLDLKYQYECLSQVRRVVKENQLIAVLSLHDLQQAALFADRIALMGSQRILAIGDSQSVLTADLIEQAYGIRVRVCPHPEDGRPMVFPEAVS